ncbi:MAG: ComF family protein [candidate division Zixibacteria bacterium]|nr:ComF family protein [candidate division Zixibacteria bacterium]
MSGLTCQTCKPAPLTIVSLGYFDENLRTIIHDLKFYGLKPVAATLGYKLADVILESVPLDYFDAIVPVPLHYSRLEKRGFNQAEEIALSIGACLNIPVYSNLLIMTRKTKQQARLSASERILNVCDAFTVKDETGILQGKKILLVDDVTTTGATLLENCKALKAAGAGKVISAVAATAV